MSKNEDRDQDQGEFSLQDLLKSNNQVRMNIERQQEESDRRDAMETHGLVEPVGTKKKSNSAEVEAMTGQLQYVNDQLSAITAERDDLSVKVSDLTNMLADRDRQIARLGEELESRAEADKVVRADETDKVKGETELPVTDDEPKNQTAEEAPKVVHPVDKPAVVVKAKDAPKAAAKPAVPKVPTAPAAKPWAAE